MKFNLKDGVFDIAAALLILLPVLAFHSVEENVCLVSILNLQYLLRKRDVNTKICLQLYKDNC